jgi:hypothetical protein
MVGIVILPFYFCHTISQTYVKDDGTLQKFRLEGKTHQGVAPK